MKLFRNGAIQMTGCKCMGDCVNALEKVCKEFQIIKGIIDPKTLKKVIPKYFSKNIDAIDINKIINTRIQMINSNFNIGFKIDREALYLKLKNKSIECSFEPMVHACVDVKYHYVSKKDNNEEKKISIFVTVCFRTCI